MCVCGVGVGSIMLQGTGGFLHRALRPVEQMSVQLGPGSRSPLLRADPPLSLPRSEANEPLTQSNLLQIATSSQCTRIRRANRRGLHQLTPTFTTRS